ncbi:MAG: hypothetical protein KAS51_07775 [Candidatus Omnitrophica bacterium]|nr:hypothetical protein [Candidatus Omnitrophota bacterium]
METEVKKLDKLKRVIKIEVIGDSFKKEKKDVYQKKAKNLKIPGFRPGTAPMDLLEKHHSEVLKEELIRATVPIFYQKAIEENKLLPASLPRIFDIKVTAEALSFSAELEVQPDVEVKEKFYKGIKLKDTKITVKDDEIEKVINNLKEGIKKVADKDLDDDSLAKWASYSDIDRLKDAVKSQLYVEKLRDKRQKIDLEVRQQLLKSFKVDLPISEVDERQKELVEREIHNLSNRGVSKEDIEKYKQELQDKIKPRAEEEVKLIYILQAIAKAEGLKTENNLGDVVFGFILSQGQYSKG